jgi:hypothetical protein
MELSCPWETASCAAIQELPSILWNPKVQYRVHNSPPLVPILSRSMQSVPLHPLSLRSILILSTHLLRGLRSGLFPSGLPADSYMHSSALHSSYMPLPSHSPWLDHSNYTWRRVQVIKLLIMQFSRTSRHFISLRSRYSPSPSPSHISTDGQSVSLSWCRALSRAHDQILVTVWQFLSCLWEGALSDERVGLSFVIVCQ